LHHQFERPAPGIRNATFNRSHLLSAPANTILQKPKRISTRSRSSNPPNHQTPNNHQATSSHAYNNYNNNSSPQAYYRRALSSSALPANNSQYTVHKTSTAEPRPSPSAGKPPKGMVGPPMAPVLPAPKLGRRCLLLGRRRTPQPPTVPPTASTPASSSPHCLGSSGNSSSSLSRSRSHFSSSQPCRDPGPILGNSTIAVECTGFAHLLAKVPKNAVALECPRCKKLCPTVMCRVMQ